MNQLKPTISKTLLAIAMLGCCSWSAKNLSRINSQPFAHNTEQEVLYLPDGRGLELLSFGYRNLVADLLWFNTINYFGKHYNTDQNYQWLGHMCDLVTSLDAKPKYVYEFCSTMLSWEANLPKESIKVLDKAILNHPLDWKFLYLRGFTKMFFLKDSQAALTDFTDSAKLPGASWIAARLAAKNLTISSDPASAIEFLREIIKGTNDETQRRALEGRLHEAELVAGLDALDKAVALFKAANNRVPADINELVSAGIIDTLPVDPFGGKYSIDESGKVSSTSAARLPKFFSRVP